MRVFRLALATILTHKVWFIALFVLIVIPVLLPYITPWETNPTIIAPARAQAAWVLFWVLSLFWSLFAASNLGAELSHRGLGSYFKSCGVSRASQLAQLWAANAIFVIAMAAVTVLVVLIGTMPSDAFEKNQWIALTLQYAALATAAILPLQCLAIALSSRFGATVGYVGVGAFGLYGLYGVDFVANMTKLEGNPLVEWFYILSPHYRLADLTERFTFKSGPLISKDFSSILVYMLLLGMVIVGFSFLIHTTRSKRA